MPKIASWDPEDPVAWEAGNRSVAWRNLAVSIPALLVAFSVWMFWSILAVRMRDAGFPFSPAQLFTLISIAGLSGATLRIPSAFLVPLAGGRNTVAVTTGLLVVPALGAGLALRDVHTPFSTFAVLATLSGIGGGNFASSMANVPGFFPKRLAGTALGLNGGLGNLGVSVMQLVIPSIIGVGLFGALGGRPPLYLANGALVWVPVLVLLTGAAWAFMDNLPGQDAEPLGPALLRILGLHALGLAVSAAGVWLLLAFRLGLGAQVGVLLGTILASLGLLKLIPGRVRERLRTQFALFRKPDTWGLTVLYLGTFGSFIGFSGALPLLINVVFGRLPNGLVNAHAPRAMAYAWLGPLVGSLFRPVGGWLADKWKGSHVAQLSFVLMALGALGVARCVVLAQGAPAPEAFFPPFLGLFLLLFVATGLGNGAVFQMAPHVTEPGMAAPTVGWISAIAAYGSFLVPAIFRIQVDAGAPQRALHLFTAFYAGCVLLNAWRYARRR
ncbi:MFS transporter [Mesoterricola silvestris]|uniref:Nitrate/nitrite transporter NarU n=1 Tax=Mesoterricola silvestris TaxID=2927979 RepID=A0AA48GNH7_9BACT|nr:MFS transporter [Mesoterricola silvestris]BDU73124.1 nitrate/nitrite transporter NarU [Mesoterricola silvestris]